MPRLFALFAIGLAAAPPLRAQDSRIGIATDQRWNGSPTTAPMIGVEMRFWMFGCSAPASRT